MTKVIQYHSGSSARTGTYRSTWLVEFGTGTRHVTKVAGPADTGTDELFVPVNQTEINDLVAQFERDPDKRAAIEEARKRIARTVHAGERTTIRTMRLRRGWSQVRFAQKLGTSQSHVARIEKAQDNLTLQTCRNICSVLEIDMNTLDQALCTQEEANAKASHQ